jgi:hypothetical protein
MLPNWNYLLGIGEDVDKLEFFDHIYWNVSFSKELIHLKNLRTYITKIIRNYKYDNDRHKVLKSSERKKSWLYWTKASGMAFKVTLEKYSMLTAM